MTTVADDGPEEETDLQETRDILDNDLDDGDILRWEAYQSAWAKCFDKLQVSGHARRCVLR